MKGPKEMKRYVAKYRDHLKAILWDDLAIFKWERSRSGLSAIRELRKTTGNEHQT